MPCFKRSLRKLSLASNFAYSLLYAAGAFRRWRCVGVVLGALRGRWHNDSEYYSSPDLVLCRAILDAVYGEPGCADGRIIRKLLRTGARSVGDFYVNEDVPRYSPFRGGWFDWEPFRLAFVERQQNREQRETPACMEMRDAILDCLTISDQTALNFLIGEPSKALYRASARQRLKRLADQRERGESKEGESSCGEISCSSSRSSSSSAYS